MLFVQTATIKVLEALTTGETAVRDVLPSLLGLHDLGEFHAQLSSQLDDEVRHEKILLEHLARLKASAHRAESLATPNEPVWETRGAAACESRLRKLTALNDLGGEPLTRALTLVYYVLEGCLGMVGLRALRTAALTFDGALAADLTEIIRDEGRHVRLGRSMLADHEPTVIGSEMLLNIPAIVSEICRSDIEVPRAGLFGAGTALTARRQQFLQRAESRFFAYVPEEAREYGICAWQKEVERASRARLC